MTARWLGGCTHILVDDEAAGENSSEMFRSRRFPGTRRPTVGSIAVWKQIIENGRGRTSIEIIPIVGLLGHRPDTDKDNALLPSSPIYMLHAVRYREAVKNEILLGC